LSRLRGYFKGWLCCYMGEGGRLLMSGRREINGWFCWPEAVSSFLGVSKLLPWKGIQRLDLNPPWSD
jgi:hypothetical protein